MTARALSLSITALSVLSAALMLAAPAMAQTKPAAAPAAAAAPATKLVPAQSDIAFTFRQMGVPVDGHFKKFDAQLAFDPKNAAAGKVTLSIELGSATIGDAATDAELVKPEWFDTKKIPTATFQSTSIKTLGGGKFEVAGKLTIKGQVRDAVVPVALAQAGGTTTATGAFAMKRLDFKIGEGEWKDTSIVANDVQVKFKLAIAGMAPL
ncbi:YceI family protein [Mitsuaria sp. GD03876]|uniref:YceI family protein n=1 Tax=Mitsuaria sp. GD03876 TaxID=2975399 RepID=UPI00244A6FC3|nr:YceI family protein [Mitsuaria sp. GD03876]MDH0865683.1 YceI family protein [Mitsuaria sp. GD03876]